MYRIKKLNKKKIRIDLPNSKSISHRILILSGLNQGKTIIQNMLQAEDTQITRTALENMGAVFEKSDSEITSIKSIGKVKHTKCYLGNSGSSARFLLPLASFVDKPVFFYGEDRLHERPFAELINALIKLGAVIKNKSKSLPIEIYPGILKGGKIEFESLPSSQIITSLMLAALWMENELIIKLPNDVPSLPYILMTYHLMSNLGIEVDYSGKQIIVQAKKPDINWNFKVEKDLSASSYWVIMGLIHGIKIVLPGVVLPSLQGDEKIFEIAETVGAQVMLYPDRIEIDGQINKNIDIDCSGIPDLVPALSVVAMFAPKPIKLLNVKHLEYKESNRIEAIRKNINVLSGKSEYKDGHLTIFPQNTYQGGIINSYNDHRIAMSFAVAGSKINNVRIDNPQCVNKSYPEFWEHFTFWEQV